MPGLPRIRPLLVAALLSAAAATASAISVSPGLRTDREIAQAPILESLAEMRRGDQRASERLDSVEQSIAKFSAADADRSQRLSDLEAALGSRIDDLRTDLNRYFAVVILMWGALVIALLGVGWELFRKLDRFARAAVSVTRR